MRGPDLLGAAAPRRTAAPPRTASSSTSLVPTSTRLAGSLALVLALIAYAYSPLLGAGFLGEDHRVWVAVEEVAEAGTGRALWACEPTAARPLATLSLLASRALWTEDGRWTGAEALAVRLEHLLLILVAAWGLHGLLRRALAPWLGTDPAKAAAHTGSALFLLHPLCVVSVGRVASRGDLVALACGAWAVRAFLSARQERRGAGLVLAGVAAVACAASSEIAWFLPPLVAGLEYLSARRHRPRARRARTAAGTLLAFGFVVALEWAARWRWAPAEWTAWFPGPRPGATFALALEKLGVLLLPVDTFGIGTVGYLFAALAVLVALHPGFVAARSAPRLWGRILLGWAISLVVATSPHLGSRVPPGSLARAEILLPCAVVMGAGFGISATALSGWRRTVLPVVVGGLYAILGRAVALPREEAASAVESLRAELIDAARARDWRTTLIVLDPPREVAGVDALGPDLDALLAPPFLPDAARARGVDVRVVGASRTTLRAWMREPEFRELRRAGAALLVGGEAAVPKEREAAVPKEREAAVPKEREAAVPGEHRIARRAVDLAPPGVGDAQAIWRTEGRTPSGTTLDPLEARFFRVSALPDADPAEAPVIRWSSTGELEADSVVTGVWSEAGHAPVALFDLEDSLAWLLGGRVRSVWFPGDLTSIVSARATSAPEPLAGEVVPRPAGDDWLFDVSQVEPTSRATTWRLTLLDLGRIEAWDLAPDDGAGSRLRFVGLDARLRAELAAGGGPFVWTLDQRAEGVTLARARGRVEEASGALPVRQE